MSRDPNGITSDLGNTATTKLLHDKYNLPCHLFLEEMSAAKKILRIGAGTAARDLESLYVIIHNK